jgi:hypothetical protein
MDEITVGPLQLCNIPDAQPGIGIGIKVKNEITVHYKSILGIRLYAKDAQLHTDPHVKELVIQLTFRCLFHLCF